MRALLLLIALVLIGVTAYYTEVAPATEMQPPAVDWSDAVEVYRASVK